MTSPIAIVGMACRYPDARTPEELWENALAQRRAFRRLPAERLRLEDYSTGPDATPATQAAVIDGWTFDRVRFRVPGPAFRAADLAHWLALDVAAAALADAGWPGGDGLPRATTGVVVGNTLTGEFSRANGLRLRWPYVRRVVEPALAELGWGADRRRAFLQALEERYKAPFPPLTEDSLAGGLSNTIAGRICNQFDLHGGGYTVDGACAASLLAVATACVHLAAGDLDVALVGGVDLSIDPFELVGFAKAGALAVAEMRVFDVRSAGFWPGEGCGFLALQRAEDAVAEGRRIYALLRGWGISSDGTGGITRPEADGQRLALARAYRRAGFGIDSVGYFEAHGTGTAVGDATELEALARARREAGGDGLPAVVSSIKANIGHTKAAAGIAGLIKATLAVHHQLLPPATACERPRPELTGADRVLRVLGRAEPWPPERPLRAAVSAMGFGGINSHVVIEGAAAARRRGLAPREEAIARSAQDAELLLLGAATRDALVARVEGLLGEAPRLSRAEVGDLAAACAADGAPGAVRAAVVASSAEELVARLETLRAWLAEGAAPRLALGDGVSLGSGDGGRLGFLFPGQGSPARLDGGALRRRFAAVDALYGRAALPSEGDGVATAVAQPAIVTASLGALRTLERLGVVADAGVGHSLGELTGLCWAGVLDDAAVLRVASARGRAMADLGSPTGAMASLRADRAAAAALLDGADAVIAALNSPRQTVVSGDAAAVAAVVARARARGVAAVALPVSHAFHSPLVAAAAPALADALAAESLGPVCRRLVSTVTGARLAPTDDPRALLVRQVTAPVRFVEALEALGGAVDLWIEVGPGTVLAGLVNELGGAPAVAVDAGGPSLRPFLIAVGAAFALGAPVDGAALFADRLTRPLRLDERPRFLASPCEQAPLADDEPADGAPAGEAVATPAPEPGTAGSSPLDVLRELVAARAELPPDAVRDGDGLLRDLHLSSLAVGQLVAEAARRMGLPPPVAPTDWADATLAEVAAALEELARTGGTWAAPEGPPAGAGTWFRAFTVALAERPADAPPAASAAGEGRWELFAGPDASLAPRLADAFRDEGGGGVVVCLPPRPTDADAALLLAGARAACARAGAEARLVVVQSGGGGSGFAKTVHLETPALAVCVVDVPPEAPAAADWVRAEARAASGYREVWYDRDGRRREPVLRLLSVAAAAPLPLGPDDVLLVTGGGKGIAAESALGLAREAGVALVLLGRADPAADAELAANLARCQAARVRYHYVRCDVSDAAAVRAAVREGEARLGPVTAVLHGAGLNQPRLVAALTEADVRATLAPKVHGARNVLAAVDPARLRLFVAFGSIIARIGLPGEADYALANEWLAAVVADWQAAHPACRCLCVEWSVWSGVGMGERLGRIDVLARQGITAIPPDEGLRFLRRLLAAPPGPTAVVVSGRFGEPPTLRPERTELPFWRFLELPRVHYPGVELVVDVELTAASDPYLDDHVFEGQRLLPAVFGLEAMAQVAAALVGETAPPVFSDVRFLRPVTVPEEGSRLIRVAALRHDDGAVEVVLRSDESGCQADHFRATCRFAPAAGEPATAAPPALLRDGAPVGLDPGRDLYGGLLFHGARFQRLRGYRRLRARECVAEIAPDGATAWFARWLPATLLLGDPGARDAVLHAIQACIPHETILPAGVDRLVPGTPPARATLLAHATERSRVGDVFVYDVEVLDEGGVVHERWQGLRLHRVRPAPAPAAWPVALLGPYLERRLDEAVPARGLAVLASRRPPGPAESGHRADPAIRAVLDLDAPVHHRPDGRPEPLPAEPDLRASAAHAGTLTLAVAGRAAVGCDVEAVCARPAAVWRDLLGATRFGLAAAIAREAREDADSAATRVWSAVECLKKAGAPTDAPLVLVSSSADRWVRLAAGSLAIATFCTTVEGDVDPVVLAMLTENGHASV